MTIDVEFNILKIVFDRKAERMFHKRGGGGVSETLSIEIMAVQKYPNYQHNDKIKWLQEKISPKGKP